MISHRPSLLSSPQEVHHLASNPPDRAKRQVGPSGPGSHPTLQGRLITIHRHAAVGDVIAATSVAKLLQQRGYVVDINAAPSCIEAVSNSPHIRNATSGQSMQGIIINLDDSYESRPDKKQRSIPELMIEAASGQLQARGLRGLDPINYANNLEVTEAEKLAALKLMAHQPRPWIVVSPTSHRPARTVPPHIFGAAAPHIKGTVFWASLPNGPSGVVDLKVRSIRMLMAVIAVSDLAIVTESAPLHIAAGVMTPAICIRQSTDPIIRVSLQRDVLSWGRRDLPCIPCGEYVCEINEHRPPCAEIDPMQMAAVTNRKLTQFGGGTVSAVIPVYSPDKQRLNRCIQSVIGQVQQVVVALDANAQIPAGVQLSGVDVCHHKVRERRGYGKTCNRGALEAWGEFTLFLNDDCYINPGAVETMLELMKDPDVAVVGCQQRYPDGTIYFGGSSRSGDGFGHLDHKSPRGSITIPTPSEFINFACALVRRKAFYSVDAFDERFDCYSEDADLCLRLQRAKWKLMYQPNATAIHEESQSTSPMKMDLLRRGSEVFNSIWLRHLRENAHRETMIFR